MGERELRTYNSAKGIATERDLKLIIWHMEAMRQARTGLISGLEEKEVNINDKKMNQVRALSLIISAQEDLIGTFSAQILFRSNNKYKKAHKTEEEQKENPFKEHDNDYNKVMLLSKKINACRMDILEAERTRSLEDDFITERQDSKGCLILELTVNFYEMLRELDKTFEEINLILLMNNCISAGIEEDEELTYKEKEKEAIRRVVEA